MEPAKKQPISLARFLELPLSVLERMSPMLRASIAIHSKAPLLRLRDGSTFSAEYLSVPAPGKPSMRFLQITCKVTAAGPAFNMEVLTEPEKKVLLVAARDSVAVQEQLFRLACYANHNWPPKTWGMAIIGKTPPRFEKQLMPHFFTEDRDSGT